MVVLRCRPLNLKEKDLSENICIDFLDSQQVEIRSKTENKNIKFTFDRVFDYTTDQQSIYESTASQILDSVLQGYNGTILAYGQTSSGKTFTMQGRVDDPVLEGIVPRLARSLFSKISTVDKDTEYVVKASIMEIYNEKIRDLLETSKQNLQIREDKIKGVHVEDLTEFTVSSSDYFLNLIKKGNDNRAINSTNMNANSSRSHSIVVLNITQNNLRDLSAKTGKLYLVDLAGSERISKTGATGIVLDEAKKINKSLTNLGNVIYRLTDGKNGHIPYRDSRLTRVLQESLGGNSKTCLIITCSPAYFNEAETLSTLRFGIRAKKVKNSAKMNKEYSIQELKQKVNNLEGQLGNFRSRIDLLEEILKKNGLPLPGEIDNSSSGDCEEIIINNNNNNCDNCEDSRDNSTTLKNYNNNNKTLSDNNIIEINSKYVEVLQLVNELENEKAELKERLTNASERINEVHIEENLKEKMVKEIEEMKSISETKSKAVQEKMKKMKTYMEKNKNNLTISEFDLTLNDSIIKSAVEENKNFTPSLAIVGCEVNIEIGREPNMLEIGEIVEIEEEEVGQQISNDNTQREEALLVQSIKSVPSLKSPNNSINSHETNKFTSANFVLEDLLDKLKTFSNQVPELNHLIDAYKDKLTPCQETPCLRTPCLGTPCLRTPCQETPCQETPSQDESSKFKSIQSTKMAHSNSNPRILDISGDKSETLQESVLSEVESKINRLFDNHGLLNTPCPSTKSESFGNYNLKMWKGGYKNAKIQKEAK